MILLQRYIFKQLIVTFLLTFLVMIAVFWLGMTIQSFRALGTAWAEFFLKTVPTLFVIASPWALLVSTTSATTLTYGRLSADNELNAIRTSGIHTNTIIVPAFLFAFFIAAVNLAVYEEGLPRAFFARRNMQNEAAITALRNPPPGKWVIKMDAVTLVYRDARNGVLESPTLDLSEDGVVTGSYQSREARIVIAPGSPPEIILVDGQFTRTTNRQTSTGSFKGEYPIQLPISPLMTEPETHADMTFAQLTRWITPPSRGAGTPKAMTEYYTRFGMSLASIPLILLAVPLGMWVKKGSRLAGLGVALPPLLLYLVLMFTFQGLGDRGRVAPWVAGFAPSIAMSVAALAALLRVYLR